VQGLEDVEVVDGEPVAASLIARAVTARELLFDDGATQTFDVNGDTSYVEADGRPTQGKWYVDEDGRFCSFWPPTYRACYGLLWIVEGDEIVGLSFTELGRGTRFDGRYTTLAHGARPRRCLPTKPASPGAATSPPASWTTYGVGAPWWPLSSPCCRPQPVPTGAASGRRL
jgi:hypothetical protein